jgi:LPXTG-motif cell wall-anchored protein
VVAKAPCEPEPPKAPPPPPKAPPPPPKAAPPAPAPAPPPPPKELPKSGGSSAVSLFALGAGALLVCGGLVARRFIR